MTTPISEYLLPEARLIRDSSILRWPDRRPVEIVGQSPCLAELLAKIRKFAVFSEPVLICGESGTGKELVARACYLLSNRMGKEFVPVNCPQQTDVSITASELFGHRKGSFTGAVQDRKGLFETADGGMIFLDEIADFPLATQVTLLRALAEGEFRRLGDTTTKVVSTRVLAATNRPLEQLVVQREFRHDLFFRLSYFRLEVPPLRQRGEDWLLITRHLLEKLGCRYGKSKKLSPEAQRRLSDYHWPGNVRQLEATITMGYSAAEDEIIEYEHLIHALHWQEQALVPSADQNSQSPIPPASQAVEQIVPPVVQFVRPASPPESDLVVRSLLDSVFVHHQSFWETVREPFLARDLNRREVREFLNLALRRCEGSYKKVAAAIGLGPSEYQKFMDFLRTHALKVPDHTRSDSAKNQDFAVESPR